MAGLWFCKLAGVTTGPLKPSELKALAQAGKLGPEDLVAQSAGGPWVPARNVRGLFVSQGATGQGPPSKSPEEANVSEAVSVPGQDAGKEIALRPGSSSPGEHAGVEGTVPQARPLPEPPPLPERFLSRIQGEEATPSEEVLGLNVPPDPPSSSLTKSGPMHSVTPYRRQQNNLVMIVALAGVAVVLLVVVILLLTGVIPLGGSHPVAKENVGPTDSAKKSAQGPGEADSSAGAAQAASEVSWIDASKKAIRREATSVRILAARLAPAPAALVEKQGEYLLLEVQIDNRADDKILLFKRWSAMAEDGTLLKLTDNKGNVYRQIVPRAALGDQASEGPQRILPTQSFRDTLVFEPPKDLEQVEYLRLELPGKAFPKEAYDPFRFQISQKMIRTTQEEPETSKPSAEELFGPSTSATSPASPPATKPSEESPIRPVPTRKRDPGQEELEKLMDQLEKEAQQGKTPPEEKTPPKTDSPKSEKAEDSGEEKPKESKPRRPRLPGQEIFDQLDTPAPPKNSNQEKE